MSQRDPQVLSDVLLSEKNQEIRWILPHKWKTGRRQSKEDRSKQRLGVIGVKDQIRPLDLGLKGDYSLVRFRVNLERYG